MGVVALVVFGLLRLTPGDPAAVIAGDYASPGDVAKIRASLGLDRPLHVQLGLWFGNLLRGDLGTSIFSGLPVTTLIRQRVEPTAALATLTMIVAIAIAVPLGVLAAWKQGSWIDRTVMVFAVSGFSMPVFWLGFLLVWVFAVQLGWLPVQGYSPLCTCPSWAPAPRPTSRAGATSWPRAVRTCSSASGSSSSPASS